MRARDTIDIIHSVAAVVADGVAFAAAFLLAAWIRFDSGWDKQSSLKGWLFGSNGHWNDPEYLWGAAAAALVGYIVMRRLRLYRRPQTGRFGDKIPRMVRAVAIMVVIGLVALALLRNRLAEDFSTGVLLLFAPCALALLLVERRILHKCEIVQCRHHRSDRRMVVVGSDAVAAHIVGEYRRDPRLRIEVAGLFLSTPGAAVDPGLAGIPVLGTEADLERVLPGIERLRLVVVADSAGIRRERLAEIVRLCERLLARFTLVPDLFRVMTSQMEVETVGDIPMLGLGRWPLENGWNRAAKRVEDIAGGIVGLILSAPVVLLFGILHKRQSPGPMFYAQERCGYRGRMFTIYKLRTMRTDAEAESGPVFAQPDDPRRTRLGSWMREHNIDELPQFWNVLKGDMSLVGPRPERPVFVEKFGDEIDHYMWRHNCRPGITGWAQVNGFRGDTSIEGRLRCDLYYLENWSLALDLKILVRTLFARKNAY